ncbi:sensor histidine kinase [Flavonifractor sp. An91]|uniref:sensor histidine kinase n=1 Tax=Flavonifractor sp. An91 TaxID=1965665 RepID=UPI000B36B949|nr:HAMP domain-containing sensor histidine kinase [Flavonifractor sp. An91]OUN14111.1 histidine kinase [Flavonifractor sp. An91]
MTIILCILLAAVCAGLGLWVWTQYRALKEAAEQLRELTQGDSTARLRMAVPNREAEELLEGVNHLLELRREDQSRWLERERSLRQQIANVSHDLRTPLTSILGYLQLLEDPSLPEGERREYLAVVESRAKALQSLITGFYDLSRLEGGEYPLEQEPVNLYTSLSGLLAAFYNDFTDRHFDMTVELSEHLPPVQADNGGVLRVFTNLIRNALDHGQGKMTVRLWQEGDKVVSLFANETDELTAEDLPHIFDRFFTSDKMRTGRNTGLGLAIVKTLAEQMGCQLTAELENGMFAIRVQWPLWQGRSFG